MDISDEKLCIISIDKERKKTENSFFNKKRKIGRKNWNFVKNGCIMGEKKRAVWDIEEEVLEAHSLCLKIKKPGRSVNPIEQEVSKRGRIYRRID